MATESSMKCPLKSTDTICKDQDGYGKSELCIPTKHDYPQNKAEASSLGLKTAVRASAV